MNQLTLFTGDETQKQTSSISWEDFEAVAPEPTDRSWPSQIMLRNPDNSNQSWTGRGRPPRWAAEWAEAHGVSVIDRDTVRLALAEANGVDVEHAQ